MLIINPEAQEPKQSIYFHSDPLVELVASLHVIGDPEHHEHCESWAIKAISHIGKTLRSEIVYFATNYSQWLFIMDIVTGIACDNWKNEGDDPGSDIKGSIRKFSEINDFDFAYMFLGLSAFHIERAVLEKWVADPDRISTAELAPVTVFI
ncbi:MAG TPA: DUF5937 family protein, partial [Anaerovoracaceae bacterium]|nr:DUF5937 family protein [Anaerovoracaceae bacterium]